MILPKNTMPDYGREKPFVYYNMKEVSRKKYGVEFKAKAAIGAKNI
jgi:hypothetical protein